ncbi:MAG TPA: phosphoribosyl-AMP cyclohydrolase [Candidatus Dormibacteraeota bacterium]|nr:phosphoribosyl-AMP cyclohydrolase [Candidatus Dormibacteraeota bacterium]
MSLKFDKMNGLIPAIVQEWSTGEVLMLGFMNPEAFEETRRSGDVTFYSRSRQKLWKKGETSGHTLRVRELRIDCDADTILVRAEMRGPGACHEGFRSCFFRRLESDGRFTEVAERAFDPAAVYGSRQS